MRDFQSSSALLPVGFSDLMPEEAQKEASAIQTLMRCFSSFGYQKIKPPLLEFEESLLAPGPGAALAGDTFRVMDPLSHRMMGLRADITPQIARIVQSRFDGEEGKPLRLTYANDVLRTRSGQLRTARQFCQVGCELIDGEAQDGMVELCLLAILGLRKLGVDAMTVDFTLPRLIDVIVLEQSLSSEQEEQLREALRKRDREAIKACACKASDLLVALLDCNGSLAEAVEKFKDLDVPAIMQDKFDDLAAISEKLPQALDDMEEASVDFSFDAFETQGFEYHNGVAFSVFAEGMRGELGRGGQYDLRFGEQSEAQKANGFTLYMDTILSGLEAAKKPPLVAVDYAMSWADVKKLQDQDWAVLRCSLDAVPKICTHVFQENKVQKINN